jgi:hypothetical protein
MLPGSGGDKPLDRGEIGVLIPRGMLVLNGGNADIMHGRKRPTLD